MIQESLVQPPQLDAVGTALAALVVLRHLTVEIQTGLGIREVGVAPRPGQSLARIAHKGQGGRRSTTTTGLPAGVHDHVLGATLRIAIYCRFLQGLTSTICALAGTDEQNVLATTDQVNLLDQCSGQKAERHGNDQQQADGPGLEGGGKDAPQRQPAQKQSQGQSSQQSRTPDLLPEDPADDRRDQPGNAQKQAGVETNRTEGQHYTQQLKTEKTFAVHLYSSCSKT